MTLWLLVVAVGAYHGLSPGMGWPLALSNGLFQRSERAVLSAMLPLAALLFVTGMGQGLAMPTLVRMVTGQVAPPFSGMIAGITSAALQISTALSVAVIGGIFYSMLGNSHSGAAITHAFIVALLIMAACLANGAALSTRLILHGSDRSASPARISQR